jgi:hypothetical protein
VLAALGLFLSSSGMACDDAKPAGAGAAPSSKATAAPPPESPPAVPAKPQLAVDDTAAFVSGERIDMAAPDPGGRYATVLGTKKVSGEDLVLEANRDAKFPKLALIVAAAAKAGAKSLLVRTPKRDRTPGEIAITLRPKWAECSAAGFISKDNATTAQTAAGRSGARFTKGMAGPDMTRASEGIRKLAAACESPLWVASADPEITWGVVADLILAVATPDDGGTPAKTREVAIVAKPPGGGHKVEE